MPTMSTTNLKFEEYANSWFVSVIRDLKNIEVNSIHPALAFAGHTDELVSELITTAKPSYYSHKQPLFSRLLLNQHLNEVHSGKEIR